MSDASNFTSAASSANAAKPASKLPFPPRGPASAGVPLLPGGPADGTSWQIHPRDYGWPLQVAMPRFESGAIEQVAVALRHVYREYGRCACYLGYIDPVRSTWSWYLPPQHAGVSGVRCDHHFTGFDPPPDELRLGASLTTCAEMPADYPESAAPRFEGMHLLLHVHRGHTVLAHGRYGANLEMLVEVDSAGLLYDGANRFPAKGHLDRVRLV